MLNNHLNRGSYIIGITGQIGSGKSLVRRMLERLGCLSVDADQLAHQAYRSGAPAYSGVLKAFGRRILDPFDEVDRRKLAEIVFSDSAELHKLEALTHPVVTSALQRLARLSPLPVIAVEAIKLFESGFSQSCDRIWLVNAPRGLVYDRLQRARGITTPEISARMESQASLSGKEKQANVVINNSGNIQDLWQQVRSEWDSLVHKSPDFQHKADLVNEITEPFKKNYHIPSMELANKMADFYANPSTLPALSLAAEDLLDLYNPRDFDELKNLCFHLLCARHVWALPDHDLPANLLLAKFSHFVGTLTAGLGQISSQSEAMLGEILHRIEGFCRLHLVSRLRINALEKIPGIEEFGFQIIEKDETRPPDSKAEYNVYEKQIMQFVDLFKEQEK